MDEQPPKKFKSGSLHNIIKESRKRRPRGEYHDLFEENRRTLQIAVGIRARNAEVFCPNCLMAKDGVPGEGVAMVFLDSLTKGPYPRERKVACPKCLKTGVKYG